MKYLRILLLAFLFYPFTLFADEPQAKPETVVKEFLKTEKLSFMLCRLQVETEIAKFSVDAKNASFGKVFDCIKAQKEKVHPAYQKARDAVADKKEIQNAIKELYAYWTPSMDAIIPDLSQPGFVYKQQIMQREQRLEEMSNRILLDL